MNNPLFSLKSLPATLLFLVLLLPAAGRAVTVEYDLTVSYLTVNYSGKDVRAMAVNGSIPGPTLRFTEGDRAVIRVRNDMDVETSVHWHGLLLPNIMDGVPYVTTPPIRPGETFTYEFDLIQSGTYWYHSHTNLQEQRGVYGSIVIEPKSKTAQNWDRDMILVLSDWTNENPKEVLRTLKRGSEWYSIRKGTAQSWNRVISHDAVGDRLRQSWARMPPMDISDVAYDAFLVNGSREISLQDVRPGERIRLRIINAAASTYFHLQYAAGPMTVVAADGPEVQPTEVERVLIAIAETYDILVTVPPEGSWEFRATAQDASGHTSLFIGQGDRRTAADIPPPNLFKMHGMMDMSGMSQGEVTSGDTMEIDMSMEHAGMAEQKKRAMGEQMGAKQHDAAPTDHGKTGMEGGDMEAVQKHESMTMPTMTVLDYSNLRSPASTALPDANPVREVRLELTGNMDRYVWAFNNKTLSEEDKIPIRRGENVRFVLVNRTMMHHPMHLHGHFFRVVKGQGEFAPLKHTVDVPPMGMVVMEFEANEEKDWFFHCHILYHMVSGMARVVSYEGSAVDPVLEAARKDQREMSDNDWFLWGEAAFMSHMHEGDIELSNTRNGIHADWEAGWEGEYEIDADYERFLSRFLGMYAGGTFTDEDERGVVGLRYVLPLYIESDLRVDTEGHVRLEIGSGIALTPRLELLWTADTDEEWEIGAEYALTKHLSISGSYHSEFDGGAGLLLRF